jgi:cysteine desulfurase/selenocysteine lyase
MPYDVQAIREQFPIFRRPVNGHPLCYLDTASSAQKPQAVIDAMTTVMRDHYANVHRGLYSHSQTTTTALETARQKVAEFIGARANEIILTRNATEAVNLVAATWGPANLGQGDTIVLSDLEHHANIVPWQILAERVGATIAWAAIDRQTGIVTPAALAAAITPRTKIVALSAHSNALGTVQPVAALVEVAHRHGALVLVDACQAVVHGRLDVTAWDCDFLVFSGHKLYGPTGIGVLYGRYDLLAAMPPYQGGGDMIDRVSKNGSTYRAPPARFEAGTPPIIEAIGLGAAVAWIQQVWHDTATPQHEQALMARLKQGLETIKGLTIAVPEGQHHGIIGVTLDPRLGHPSDLAVLLDRQGVAVRAGHHCCMPLMEVLGVPATLRLSLGLYTTAADIDQALGALDKAVTMLG